MSTGAWPEVHGNVAYVFDRQSGLVRGQNRFLGAETVAQALAEAGLTVASVQWYMIQDHGVTYGDPDHLYVQPGGPCQTRVDTALAILDGSPVDSGGQPVVVPGMPNLLAVYCDDLDALGHEVGADDPRLGRTLEEMDRQLGRLVEKVRQVGALESTTFVLTGDHGMTSWNRSLLPAVLAELTAAGFTPEIVTPGQGPAPSSDVVIVPNSRRTGAFSLRGPPTPRARVTGSSPPSRRCPRSSASSGPDELRALHASSDEGDVIAEAAVPFGFGQSEPPPGQWRGSHGSLAERHVPLLLAGAGDPPRRRPATALDWWTSPPPSPPCSASTRPTKPKDGPCARSSSSRPAHPRPERQGLAGGFAPTKRLEHASTEDVPKARRTSTSRHPRPGLRARSRWSTARASCPEAGRRNRRPNGATAASVQS